MIKNILGLAPTLESDGSYSPSKLALKLATSNKTDYELAKKIMDVIKVKTGLIGTAGIGPNMLIAKVAMDTEAKHTKDNIA
ncbi:MAG: hypothetical protein RJA90_282, partial [Bacteroidota bacterium]